MNEFEALVMSEIGGLKNEIIYAKKAHNASVRSIRMNRKAIKNTNKALIFIGGFLFLSCYAQAVKIEKLANEIEEMKKEHVD